MARNKYPEETRKLIIETAGKLFIEKGYDQTSIQDIINHLGGLSKGAVYYHFKSKEEILWAVADWIYSVSSDEMYEIAARKDINGREKMHQILRASLSSPAQTELFTVAPDMLNNPQLLSLYLKNCVLSEANDMLIPIMEEGMADGSIQTEYPNQLAEVFLILGNIWLNPMVYHCETRELVEKMKYFKVVLKSLGLDIVDDDMIAQMEKYSNIYQERKSL